MLPIVGYLNDIGCFEIGKGQNVWDKRKTEEKVFLSLACTDLIIFITTLTLGILGLCSVIHNMPLAASYALVGAAVFVVSAWSAAYLYANCKTKVRS